MLEGKLEQSTLKALWRAVVGLVAKGAEKGVLEGAVKLLEQRKGDGRGYCGSKEAEEFCGA